MAFFSWSRWLRSLLRPAVKPIRKPRTQLRLESLEQRLAPATFNWTGQTGDGKWSDPNNWLSNGVHVAPQGLGSDDLNFPAGVAFTTSNNDIATGPGPNKTPIFNSITVSGSGYTIGGDPITLGSSTIVNGQTGFVTINAPAGAAEALNFRTIYLGGGADSGQQDFSTAAFNTLTIGGVLASPPNTPAGKGLKAIGSGTIVLTQPNTFIEPFTIVGGIVQITNSQALGDPTAPGSTNTTTVDANAQLQLAASNAVNQLLVNEPLFVNGQGTHNDGAVLNLIGNNSWLNSNTSYIVLGTATPSVFFGVAGGTSLSIPAQISDQGSGVGLTKVGAGQLILSNANTYRNLTDIENGILTIQNAHALGNYEFGNSLGRPVHIGNVITNDNTVAQTYGTLEIDDETGSGMVINNELLTLNGPGFNAASPGTPVIGALHNKKGNNTWSGSVSLGGTVNPRNVWVGVDGGTDLLISGVIGDPSNYAQNGGPFSLDKFLPGKLIFTASNTYLGATRVDAGVLNLEDSRALGPDNKANGTTVSFGAALELQLQTDNLDGLVPVPALDSETQRSNQMIFQQTLSLSGTGIGQTGALHSISGINAWERSIFSAGAGIGVEPDPHQANSQLYFPAYDNAGHAVSGEYSLTVGTPQGVVGFPGSGIITGSSFIKEDNGHLILPQNNPISADIEQGWVTVETTGGISGSINVAAGAALHLKPVAGTSLVLPNDITLNGTGINHPFGLINQMGAIENLVGINTLTGIIHLNGVAGIGVENVFGPGNFFGTPGVFGSSSQLTISGYVWDGVVGGNTVHGGITKLGSDRLVMAGLGSYTGPVDIADGVFLAQSNTALGAGNTPFATTTVEPGYNTVETLDFLNPVPGSTKFTLTLNNKPVANGATFTYTGNAATDIAAIQTALQAAVAATPGATVSVITTGGGQYQITFGGTLLTFNQQLSATVTGGGTLTVVTEAYGSGTALEIANSFPNQIIGGNLNSETGGLAGGLGIWAEHLILTGVGDPNFNDKGALTVLAANDFTDNLGPYQDPLFAADHLWNGPITLKPLPVLSLTGPTIYVPAQSRITLFGTIDDAGTNSSLTVNGTGEVDLAGANTYGGMTNINSGIVTVENSQALGSPGIAAVQTIDVTALTPGAGTTFSVSFNGSAAVSVPYTGNTANDIAALTSALNHLSTIGGPAGSNIGGSVTVAENTAGVFSVTLGGSLIGFAQPNIQSTTNGVVVQTVTPGGGGTIVKSNAQLQLAGRITVANEPLLVSGNGDPNLATAGPTAPTVPMQWFPVGPAPESNGQTLGNQGVGGRITGIANAGGGVIYVATAGGGAWKTVDGGNAWRPIFDSIPNLENLVFTPTGTAITYTLSFTGKDATGAVVTDTTGNLTYDPTNLAQSMQDIQNALGGLNNIGGIGGVVTVTQSGANRLLLTFGGVAMAGNNLTGQLTATPVTTGSNITDVQVEAGSQPGASATDLTSTPGLPFAAMYVGAITWDAGTGTLYVGTGEGNVSTDSYYGTGLYASKDGGVSWSLVTDSISAGPATPFNPFYGQAINKIAYDPVNPTDLYVATTTLVNGPPLPNMPTKTPAAAQQDANRAPLAGIWRFAAGTWYNMTDWTTGGRLTLAGAPGTPGPDDDFGITFNGADWTDVQVIEASDPYHGFTTHVYAALGNPTGNLQPNGSANAVYWCGNPLNDPPSWYVGDPGTLQSEIQEITFSSDPSAGQFTFSWSGVGGGSSAGNANLVQYAPNVNQLTVPNGLAAGFNAIIGPGRWSANSVNFDVNSATIDVTFVGNLADSPQPLIKIDKPNGLTIKVSEKQAGGGFNKQSGNRFNAKVPNTAGDVKIAATTDAFGNGVVYASVTNYTNQSLLGVYKTTDTGLNWAAVGNQPGNDQGNEGAYDNAIALLNTTQVFIGGMATSVTGANAYTQMIFYTPDGGNSWIDESTVGGISPHTSIHALAADGTNNVLVGTDGGLFELQQAPTGNYVWANLNGNVTAASLDIQSMNAVVPGPTDPSVIYGGATNNGLEVFNAFAGGQPWQGTQSWNEINDPNNGHVVGASRLLVDPNNPQIMYEVQDQLSNYNSEADQILYRTTDGGATWTQLRTLEEDGPLPISPTNLLPPPQPEWDRGAPLIMDQVNTQRILTGDDFGLYESTNGGASWLPLSAPGRGPTGLTAIALAAYQGVFAADTTRFPGAADVGANTYVPDTIYAATGGTVWVTKDHGQHWFTSTPGGSGTIVDLQVDPRNRDVVYAVRNGFGNTVGGQVWISTDAGQSWHKIGGDTAVDNLPNVRAWKLVIDPRNGNLYVGTDIGVYEMPYGSNQWQRFGTGMPNAEVKDLQLNPITNVLVAGTYGRGTFELFLDPQQSATPLTPSGQAAPVVGAVVALAGQPIWTGPVILANDGSGTVTFAADGNPILRNGVAAAQLDFQGTISDQTINQSVELDKLGTGNIVLSGRNTYGGLTHVKQGDLIVNNPQALGQAGSAANGTVVDYGTALQLESSVGNASVPSTSNEWLTLNGDGPTAFFNVINPALAGVPSINPEAGFDGHNTGALESIASINTYYGPITLATNSTIGVDAQSVLTITGNITDNGNDSYLIKELSGTLILNDTNNYTGQTFVMQGVLQIASSTALTVSPVTVLDGAQIQLANGVTVNDSLSLSGTGIGGSGAILGVGASSTWAGPVMLDANPGFSVLTDPLGTVAFAAGLNDILTITGSITDEAASQLSGMASGVSIVGQGTVVFAAANTYTGSTYVNSPSTLVAQNAQALAGMGSSSPEQVQDPIQRITVFDPSYDGVTASGTFALSYNGLTSPLLSTVATTGQMRDAIATLLGLPTGPNSPVSVTVTSVATPPTLPSAAFPTPTLHEFVYTVVIDVLKLYTALGAVDIGSLLAQGQGNVVAKTSVVANGGVGTLVRSGGTLGLNLPNGSTVSGVALQLNGTGVGGHGALQNVGSPGNSVTWGGPTVALSPIIPAITLGTASKADANGNFIDAIGGNPGTNLILQPLQGALPLDGTVYAELAKVGPGTLTLPTANSYAGTTDVRDGVLSIANNNALGKKQSDELETITINGSLNSTFDLFLDGVQIATTVSTNYLNGTATLDQLNAELKGLATVTQSSTNLNVYTIDFNGSFQGKSIAGKPVDLVVSDNVTVVPTELVRGGLGGTFVNTTDEVQTVTINGSLNSTFDLSLDGVPIATAVTTNYLNGTATLDQLTAALNGIGTVTQSISNPNVFTIDFNGSFQGKSIAGGPVDLLVSDNPSVATAEQTHGGGGTLQLTAGITYNSGESLTLASLGFNPGTGSLGALESTPNGTTANTWSNALVLASDSTIGVDPVSPAPPPSTAPTPPPVGLIINQPITGPAGFNKINQGTLEITNLIAGAAGSNTYGGVTYVTDGLVELNDNGAIAIPGPLVVGDNTSSLFPIVQLEGDNQIAFSGNEPVTVNADGLLDLNGHTQTLAQLNIHDGVAQTGNGGALTLTPTAQLGSTLALTMVGGVLNLNTGGVVNLNGNLQATSDPTQVKPAATITSDPDSTTGLPTGVMNAGNSTFTVNFPTTVPATTAATDLVDLDIQVPLSVDASHQIIKQGAGRLELDADSSTTMQSALLVNAGDVQVDGVVGHISIASTGTGASVGGNGTIETVDGGTASAVPLGTINPGDNGSGSSKTGILTIGSGTNTTTWGQDPTNHGYTSLAVDLTHVSANPTPQAGLDYDQLKVNGVLNLGGSGLLNTNGTILTGTVDPTVKTGDQFTIVTTAPGGTINGRFSEPYGDDVNPANPNNPYGVAFINGAKFDVHYLPDSAGPTGPYTSIVLTRAKQTVTTFEVDSSLVANQSVYGQDVVFTANVVLDGGFGTLPPSDAIHFVLTNSSGTTVYQETVTFKNGAPTFDPQKDNNNNVIGAGTYKVTMTLVPDPNITDPGTATFAGDWTINPDGTTTTLSPTSSNSLWSVPATVTATVAALQPPPQITGTPAPKGTVNFIVDNTTIVPGTLNASGVATAVLPATLAIGQHSIKAAYIGADPNYKTSNATSSITVNVVKDNTQAQVGTVGGATPVVSGQGVTFTALITPIGPATQTPQQNDSVIFIDAANNNAVLGSVQITSLDPTTNAYDTAYLYVPSLSVGQHKIEAEFLGDAYLNANDPSVGALTFTVGKIATTTTLSASANPAVYQSQVQFTATVSAASSAGAGTLFGVVDFYDGDLSHLIGAANLDATGHAVVQTNSLSPTGGITPHSIIAVYVGNANYATSQTSGNTNVSEQIEFGDATTVTASPSPATYNSALPFTITATVTTAANTPPGNTISGSVTFFDTINGVTTQLPSLAGSPNPAPLVNGHAYYTIASLTSQLPIALNNLTAQFNDSNTTAPVFITSSNATSPFGEYVMSQTATAVTSSTGTSAAGFGAPVTFTATIAPVNPGTGTPANGTVQFMVDGTPVGSPVKLGSDNLGNTAYAANVAAFVTSTLSLTVNKPNHAITAFYSGDNTNYAASNGSLTGGQAVYYNDSVTLNVSATTTGIGIPVTLTGTVTPINTTNVPTGTVTFYDGATAIAGPFNLSSSGQTPATPVTFTTLGNHSLTAVYNFNINTGFIGNTSAPQNVVVEDATSTALSVSSTTAQPYVFGQNVTLSATVTNTTGSAAPTGTVTFEYTIGGVTTALGSVSYPAQTTLQTTALPVGANYSIQAVYTSTNSPALFTSTGGPSAVTVIADGTNTAISSSDQTNAVYTEPLTMTATVTAATPGSGTPTGTVQFAVNGNNVGSPATVGVNGQATIVLPAPLAATGSPYTITATFTPGGAKANDYTTSNSSLSQTVMADNTNTGVTASVTGGTAVYGQAVTLTATVTAQTPGTGVPVGTVQFSVDGNTVSGQVNVGANGQATFVLPTQLSIAGSPHAVTAVYTSTGTSLGNFNGSNGSMAGGLSVVADNTGTTLTASTGGTSTVANAAVFGEAVTFTATVTPQAPGTATPTGSVQFTVDNGAAISVPLGQDNLGNTGFASDVALFVTSTLSVTPSNAPHSIVATFVNADGNFNNSSNSANPLHIVVDGAGTSTTVSLVIPTGGAVYSAPVTLLATVAPIGLGGGTPTGTVTFVDSITGSQIGNPVTLAGGVASLDISTLTPLLNAGTYNIEAIYSGDPNFANSDNTSQPPPVLTITQDGTTTTVVTSSDASAVFSEPVTFTAIITPNSPGTAVPLGSTVNFLDGIKVIGSGTVAYDSTNNVYYATYTTSTLTVATHSIKAQYQADSDAGASASPTALAQRVSVAPTAITGLTSSNSTDPTSGDPTYFGQTVTFTATVGANAPATGTPTGTVTFKDNGVALTGGTVRLVGNTAVYATAALAVGTAPHSITAVYNGQLAAFAASPASAPLSQTVLSAQTSTTLVGPANPAVFNSLVKLTATVTAVAPGAGIPTGSVQFKVDGTPVGLPVALTGGKAVSAAWKATPFGPHTVTITYSPGASLSFAGSNVATTLDVDYPSKASVSSSLNPAFVGDMVTLTATVTAGTGTGIPQITPGGSVNFLVNGTVVNSSPIPVAGTGTKATATFALNTLPKGTDSVTVQYLGDGTFAPVASAALSQAVYAIPASMSAHLVKAPASVGFPFTVYVRLYDSNGNPITLSAGKATISELSGPAGGFAARSVSFNNKTGMFTFSGLSVTKPNSALAPVYTLQVTFLNLQPVTVTFSLNGRVS